MTENAGAISITHFSRILFNLGLHLKTKDLTLLVKKFVKHNYLINYLAFIKAVEFTIQYMTSHNMIDPKYVSK